MCRAKSREEKIVGYLVGGGFFSNIPDDDVAFYRLAGSCSSASWPTKPRLGTTSPVVAEDKQLKSCDRQLGARPETVDQHVEHSVTQEADSSDVLKKVFIPKPSLPFPLYQETFHRWKSSMNMQWRFRRLRRLRASIVLQPLDEFPSFLADFRVQLRDYGHLGFCELLHEFMKVFFSGANIRLSSAAGTSGWDVTSRVHESTGRQQVAVYCFFSLSTLSFKSELFETRNYFVAFILSFVQCQNRPVAILAMLSTFAFNPQKLLPRV